MEPLSINMGVCLPSQITKLRNPGNVEMFSIFHLKKKNNQTKASSFFLLSLVQFLHLETLTFVPGLGKRFENALFFMSSG